NHRAARALRQLLEVLDERRKRSVAIEIELDVRDVERRKRLPALANRAGNARERVPAAHVAHDRDDEVALLERADDVERRVGGEVAPLMTCAIGLAQELAQRRVVVADGLAAHLEDERQPAVDERAMKRVDRLAIRRRERHARTGHLGLETRAQRLAL